MSRAGSSGRERPKQTGTEKRLGADLEAANLEVLDQASFAQHASMVAKDRQKVAEKDAKKARLARLDRVQRPGTAPASRRSAGSRTPTGGKKKSKLSTKELDKKLRQSKLRNLLRRIKEEAEAGPNYHGVTKVNPLDFYEFGEEIGKGAFGKVREATHLLTGARVAVKTYEKHIIRKFESRRADVGEKIANTPDDESGSAGKKRTGNLNDRRPFCVEAEILVRLNHANCVELYQTIDSAQRIHVIIEYVDGGTLDQYRKQFQERKLEEADAARCFAQIVAALEYAPKPRMLSSQNADLLRCAGTCTRAPFATVTSSSTTFCSTSTRRRCGWLTTGSGSLSRRARSSSCCAAPRHTSLR